MRAEIVSVGTELLLGETADTNSYWLAGQLPLLGVELNWVSVVGDNRERLVEVLQRAWGRSELILVTGGLGPTDDDLTRDAIADMLGEKLEIALPLESALRERFVKWGMEMPLSNLRQATLIPSARALPNTEGTAPGWWVERDARILVALPGPPREMQEMWRREVEPGLQKRSGTVMVRRTFKTFGLSEAAVGESVTSLFTLVNPNLGVYAKPDGIQLRFTAQAQDYRTAEAMLSESEAKIRACLGASIWGTDEETLEAAVGRLLMERRLSLAVMEDYSGGWLAAGLTDVPESPVFFKGGLIACSDEARMAFGISPETISRYGSVSPQVAQAMAEAARQSLKADVGIGITGIEENRERPVGIVYIGVANGNSARSVSRPRGKRRVTASALIELRKFLLEGR